MGIGLRSAIVALALVVSAPLSAAAVIKSTASVGQALSGAGAGGCYAMGLGYDPTVQSYYGGGGGGPGCNGTVWNSGGDVVQNMSPINVDLRGVYYNPNSGDIETLSFGASYDTQDPRYGLVALGRDANGLYTGNNTNLVATFEGMADPQAVAAYDSGRDLLYTRVDNMVFTGRHSDGALVSTITLDLQAGGVGNMQYNSIAFDVVTDTLIVVDPGAYIAHIFDTTGLFLGSSNLTGASVSIEPYYDLSFTNGQLFVGDGNGSWQGFGIFEGGPDPVPEPAALGLLGLGVLGLAARRRRRA